jgi:hypothetical protein
MHRIKEFMISDPKPNELLEVPPQGRQKSSSYPGFTLEQAEELAKAAFNLGPRNCDQERVAEVVGYTSIKSGSYLRLKSAASQFELIKIERNGALSVSEEWIKVFHEDDLQSLNQARRKAIERPKLYQQLIEEYAKRQLPHLDKLAQALHINQKYGIVKDAAITAARVFHDSANYAGLINDNGFLLMDSSEIIPIYQECAQEEEKNPGEIAPRQDLNLQETALGQKKHKTDSNIEIPNNLGDLEKYEITLTNGKKAYMYVPVPLPYGEKNRLKQYVDLILEEPCKSTSDFLYQEDD